MPERKNGAPWIGWWPEPEPVDLRVEHVSQVSAFPNEYLVGFKVDGFDLVAILAYDKDYCLKASLASSFRIKCKHNLRARRANIGRYTPKITRDRRYSATVAPTSKRYSEPAKNPFSAPSVCPLC